MSGTACLVLEVAYGGQIRQQELLSAVSDSSQQVVIIKLAACGYAALHCSSAFHCFALRTGAGLAYTQSTWIQAACQAHRLVQ